MPSFSLILKLSLALQTTIYTQPRSPFDRHRAHASNVVIASIAGCPCRAAGIRVRGRTCQRDTGDVRWTARWQPPYPGLDRAITEGVCVQ